MNQAVYLAFLNPGDTAAIPPGLRHSLAPSMTGEASLYRIVATDISAAVLEKAVRAVYRHDALGSIPAELKKRYFLKKNRCFHRQLRAQPGQASRARL